MAIKRLVVKENEKYQPTKIRGKAVTSKYLAENTDEIMRLYRENEMYKNIAAKFGCSLGAINNVIRRNATITRSRGQPSRVTERIEPLYDEIVAAYERPMSISDVGQKFNCSGNAIFLLFKRHGYQARPNRARPGHAKQFAEIS